MGWIKLHRQLLQWEWYTEANTCRLFLHLLLTANNQDKKWRGIEIKRGQRICSLQQLANEIGISLQNVRTAIKNLESTGEITRHSNTKGTVITVTKYDAYQAKETLGNMPATVNSANPQHTYNAQSTTTKETQEVKETILHTTAEIPKKQKTDFQKVFEAGASVCPNLVSASTAIIHQWLADGVNADQDAIPEIRRLGQSKPNLKSWNYFTGAILDAKATRLTPLPEGRIENETNFKNTAPKGRSRTYSNANERAKAAIRAGQL